MLICMSAVFAFRGGGCCPRWAGCAGEEAVVQCRGLEVPFAMTEVEFPALLCSASRPRFALSLPTLLHVAPDS